MTERQRGREDTRREILLAARRMDWGQVAANGGPSCFHLEPETGCFCGRAEAWQGHDAHHIKKYGSSSWAPTFYVARLEAVK